MAAFQFYNRGLNEWGVWAGGNTYRALLLKGAGYTFDKDHDFVSDLTPASNEVSSAGYARVAPIGSQTNTIDDTNDRVKYGSATFDFGTITTGQTVTGMVIYRFITNDAASVLMAYAALDGRDTAATVPFTVTVPNGIAYIDAV